MLDLKELRGAVRFEGGISRRLLLAYGAALSTLPLLAEQASGARVQPPSFKSDPFTLGVASGDPDHTGFVLWTKLAPTPLDPDGGMPNAPVDVRFVIAEDENLKAVVKSGTARATPLLGHTVHVEVDGLQPDRWYWYQFMAGDAQSPVGRARTLPAPGAKANQLRFAFASCQHYEAGFFNAYGAMAQDDLDLVFHLGDYIYEGAGRDGSVRRHANPKIFTLDDYRIRHAQYRSDAQLSKMHARCPWFVTWDDHEVENNYASDIPQSKDTDPAEFLIQRANAYQAYYEMMPLRRRSIPRGPDMQLYRKASFGNLAEFLILDTRQYRTDQPNGDKQAPLNADALNAKNTLMGPTQREWLKKSLTGSPATWNILAQQVMMGMADTLKGPEHGYSMDQWPGYAYERMELMRYIADRKVKNPVVLTGDIHSNWVNDLRVDDRKMDQPIVAAEFVGTSITSGGNGTDRPANLDTLLSENPFIRYHNRQRGYVRCTVTPSAWKSDYVIVPDVTELGSKAETKASFVVEAGKTGIKSA